MEWDQTRIPRGGSTNSSTAVEGGGGGSGQEFFKGGGGVRVQVRGSGGGVGTPVPTLSYPSYISRHMFLSIRSRPLSQGNNEVDDITREIMVNK